MSVGGCLLIESCGRVELVRVRISGGWAAWGGGVAIVNSDSVMIEGSEVSRNGYSGAVGGVLGAGFGGGIVVKNCTSTVINGTRIEGNGLSLPARLGVDVLTPTALGGGMAWVGESLGASVWIGGGTSFKENWVQIRGDKNSGAAWGGGVCISLGSVVGGRVRVESTSLMGNFISTTGALNSGYVRGAKKE